MGRADLHTHTTYSHDAATTVRGVLKQAASLGLDSIAITDHDQIRGALEALELAPIYGISVIPGIEISTLEGHVLALFVRKPVPPGLTLVETLLRIGDMGGLAIAPHPINKLPGSLSMQAIVNAIAHDEAKHVLKGIEVYNMGHAVFNEQAQKFSRFLPLAKTASSDSHVYWTIGDGQTKFPGSTPEDLRTALENMTTVPVATVEPFTPRPILSWMGHITLRRFGYVADNIAPEKPMIIRRMNNRAL